MIFDGFGSSETGAQGATVSTDGSRATHRRRRSRWTPHTCVLDEDLGAPPRRPASDGDRLARAQRPHPARLLRRRREDAQDLSRPSPACATPCPATAPSGRRRHHPRPRPRLGVHQQRRREDLRRGGRARAQAPPGGVRRRRRRHAERALGRAGHRHRRSSAPGASARRRRAAREPPPSTSRATSCRRPSSFVEQWCARPAASPTTAGRRRSPPAAPDASPRDPRWSGHQRQATRRPEPFPGAGRCCRCSCPARNGLPAMKTSTT